MLQHFHFLHFTPNKELKELYLNLAIRSFGFSLIAVFIPVYLLQLGYGVSSVLAFYAVNFAVLAVSCWIGAVIMSRIGAKHTIALSIPFLALFYLLLIGIGSHGIPILMIAAVHGFQDGLYWIAYHTDFAGSTKKRARGEAIGVMHALPRFVSIFGPVAGAFVISAVSFTALFAVAVAVFIASAMPLFASRDVKPHYMPSVRKVFARRKKSWTIANFGIGMRHIGNNVLWPMFIFILLGSVVTVGEAITLMMLFMTILNLAIGRLSDVHSSRVIMRIGGILEPAVWVLKAGANSLFSVLGISAIGGMTSTISNVPFSKKTYNRSRRQGVVEYFLYRETMFGAGRVFVLLFSIIALSSSLPLAILLAGAGSLGFLIF